MSKKSPASRFAEVFLSMGIPAIGYIRTVERVDGESLAWQIPVILLASGHVMIVNDNSFGNSSSLRKVFFSKKNITGTILFPLFILPSLYISPILGILLYLTMLNWDIYSLKGKRYWHTGLIHNFLGGALHFIIGIACAGNSEMGKIDMQGLHTIASCWPEILFFAFAMTAGAMHHDSFDSEEDKESGYTTGAVRFSPVNWWRLAILPFIGSVGFLVYSQKDFMASFKVSSIAYILVYTIISFKKNPTSFPAFRTICRIAFVLGAMIYLYFKVS